MYFKQLALYQINTNGGERDAADTGAKWVCICFRSAKKSRRFLLRAILRGAITICQRQDHSAGLPAELCETTDFFRIGQKNGRLPVCRCHADDVRFLHIELYRPEMK